MNMAFHRHFDMLKMCSANDKTYWIQLRGLCKYGFGVDVERDPDIRSIWKFNQGGNK